MKPDRRHRRIRGLLARLVWPLRRQRTIEWPLRRQRTIEWTEQDQVAFEVWAEVKRETP